ncbi:hypothetical protein MAXJ12_30787 [Mesorhizobium alhagi CCNWXJ12-2]|uniref:Uncharacterized protein n=1 Tax=Mesorhizobium alhagi CCNWXJ12-2 TaxID=1107882 RepID=H0I120_9HYPH|nr:hypothetical protein MAXJ12_30787 [Mesorhizobium alhagi CCNWXJ12-2]
MPSISCTWTVAIWVEAAGRAAGEDKPGMIQFSRSFEGDAGMIFRAANAMGREAMVCTGISNLPILLFS